MIRSAACVFAIVVVTLSSVAPAQEAKDLDTIYATARANVSLAHDGPLAQRAAEIIKKQGNYLASQLHAWDQDPHALLLTHGGSTEGDIRPNTHTAFGFAMLGRVFDDSQAKEKAIAILRFVLPTHGAGGLKCADGKQWHNQWQSAYWATSAGRAAWLLWDDLDPHLKWLAARMICDEADRFIDAKPPMQIERDTKAEENAWDSEVIALAFNMFPHHPHHERYREAAIRWQISSFVTSRDAKSDQVIDGKPLKDWLTGANLYDDFTLENHDRVHPDYMGTTRIILYQKLTYDWAGNAPPQSLRYNLDHVYAVSKKLAMPDGNFIYPNGQDWQIHRNADWFDLHAFMATQFDDAQAARLMRISIDTCEKMQSRSGQAGGIQPPDEVLVNISHGILFELYADAYLILRASGEGPEPVDEAELWKQLAGTDVFDSGKFAVVRTEKSIATFSWGRQTMGLVMPLRQDILLTPNTRSMIGSITMPDGKQDAPVVKQVKTASIDGGGFAIIGLLARTGGAAEQHFAFVTLADGRTIYIDRLHITGEKKPASINLGTLGVLNDRNWVYHDGERTLTYEGGERVFRADEAAGAKAMELSSPWYNLDGLSIVCLKSSGKQVYNAKPSPIKARLEQVFTLSAALPDSPAETALVFYPNLDPQQTKDAASRCKLVQPDAATRVVTLDDGKTVTIDLDHLSVGVK